MARFVMLSYEFRQVQARNNQSSQQTLFPAIDNNVIDENFKRKQELFARFFHPDNFPQVFEYKNRYYRVGLLWQYNGIIVFQLEKQGWHKQSLDFQRKKIPDNPWIDIIVDNRHECQLIAVRKNTTAFKYQNTVAEILSENFTAFMLKNYGLTVSVRRQYHSRVFWDLYSNYYKTNGIEKLQFNLPFPNKDWMTEKIEELKQFGKKRNGAVRLGLEAAKGEALYFEDNEENKSLVNACSGTGVDILMKPKNHRMIHVVKEMNPVEQEMSDSTLQKVLSPDAQRSLFEDNDLTAYTRTAEFLNKCQQYYE